MTPLFRVLSLTPFLLISAACVPIVAGGAAVGGMAVAEERTLGTSVDDATIKTKIWNRYVQSDVKNLYFNVEIKVNEGRVLLTGPVQSQDAAMKAVQLAWDVEGVKEVINELQVQGASSFSNYAKDAWITTQLKTRLLAEQNIRSVNYTIETVNSVVYIMGIAQSQQEMDLVLHISSTVKGVTKVVSHARVKTDPLRNQGQTRSAAPVETYQNNSQPSQQSGGYVSEFTPQVKEDTSLYQPPAPIEVRELAPPTR